MTQFSMAGCFANKLGDDLVEAQEEINTPAAVLNKDWRLLFDPRNHELAESAGVLEQFQLPNEELEDLGAKVVQLREQVKERVRAMKDVVLAG